MDINRMTQKSQEALQGAQTKAVRYGHQQVDGEHLLLTLLEQEDGLIPRLFQRMDIPLPAFRQALEKEIEKRPRVSGDSEVGKIYVTQRLQQLLAKAEAEAQRLKDEYVSVEHLMLAFLAEGTATETGKLLASFNVTEERFLETLTAVRGTQRVTSATPEGAYEALEKYGVDLVSEARAGKLDPVIGRDTETVALSKAVKYHLEHRVFMNHDRTVIFR